MVFLRRFADLCKEKGGSEMKLYQNCVNFVILINVSSFGNLFLPLFISLVQLRPSVTLQPSLHLTHIVRFSPLHMAVNLMVLKRVYYGEVSYPYKCFVLPSN